MKTNSSFQVWRWDSEGGAPIQVTHSQHDVQTVSLSPDGGRLVLTLEAPPGIDRKKLSEQGILYDGSFDATGQSIIDRLATTPSAERETWIQDLANGNTHKATIEEQRELTVSADATVVPDLDLSGQIFTKKEIEEQKIYSYNVSPDRKKVAYWRIVDDASQSQFRTYPLLVKLTDGGSPVTLTTWPYYPGEYWWSPDSKQIYFTEDNGNHPDDPHTTRIMAAAATGGEAEGQAQKRANDHGERGNGQRDVLEADAELGKHLGFSRLNRSARHCARVQGRVRLPARTSHGQSGRWY